MAKMKKIKIEITQTLEIPDDCEVVNRANEQLIKLGGKYFLPGIEYMQSDKYSEKEMKFVEMDEDSCDQIYSAIIKESFSITDDES